jgi:hypothetical protein
MSGTAGDGAQFSYNSQLNVTGVTPGKIAAVMFRGQATGFQRGIYFVGNTRGQTFGDINIEGTFTAPATAGSFPVSISLNNDSDVNRVWLKGTTIGGSYGVNLQHTTSADVDISASGFVTDAVNNAQSGASDALNRFNIRASLPSTSAGQHRGTVTTNGATPVLVTNISARTLSLVQFQLVTVGGTPGPVHVSSIVSGTSFSAVSTAGDTSTYAYTLSNPLTGP